MPTMWDEVDVQCPYFISSNSHGIRCEGALKNSTVKVQFQRQEQLHRAFQERCCGDFELCPQAMAACAKYKDWLEV